MWATYQYTNIAPGWFPEADCRGVPLIAAGTYGVGSGANHAMPTVIGVGDNTVDVYLDKRCMFPGGNSVNVAAMAARLGCPAAYVGCLSYDLYGTLVHSALKAEGLDLTHCRRAAGPNACALIGHVEGDRVFLGSRPGVRAEFQLGQSDYDFIASFDIVHTSVNSDLDDVVPRLAATGAFLSFDASNKHTAALRDRLAPHLDVVFLSLSVGGSADCVATLEEWRRAGARIAIATRGAQGSIGLSDAGVHQQVVIAGEVVDTLGAGDGFIAGFLADYHNSASVPSALGAGARNAAAVCGVVGAFGHGVPFQTLPPNLPPRRDGKPLELASDQRLADKVLRA